MPVIRTTAQANARLAQSCTECRRRKKPCEGDIPGCVSCVRRGTIAQCRYGDHRDNDRARKQGAAAAAVGGVAATARALDRHSKNVAYANHHADDVNGQDASSTSMPSWRARLSMQRARLPQRWQADRLIELHRTYLSFAGAMLMPDAHLTRLVYGNSVEYDDDYYDYDDDDTALPNVLNVDASVLALMLMICASSVKLLPTSLTLPIITSAATAVAAADNNVADVWTRFAVEFYEHGDLYGAPRLEVVAGLTLYEINLVSIGNRASMIHRLDDGIRISRMLGLDRLGSADDDQRRWTALSQHRQSSSSSSGGGILSPPVPPLLSSVPLTASAAGDWAATTNAHRDHRLREIGRSLWYVLVTRDWNAGPQTGGTFTVFPGTFTTKPPNLLLRRTKTHARDTLCTCRYGDAADDDEAEIWHFHYEAADCFRRYHELYAEAASRNEEVQYSDLLALDAHMQKLLNQRPMWIRPESGTTRWRFHFDAHLSSSSASATAADQLAPQQCSERICIVAPYVPQQFKDDNVALCCSAIELLSSTLWHKSFIIHRPFLARSLTQPSIYGLSQQRTLQGALQLIEVNNHYYESLNSTAMLFRLQHAAVALITMLLLQGALYPFGQQRRRRRRAATLSSDPLNFGTSDTLRIHKGLMFVIRLFKEHERDFGGGGGGGGATTLTTDNQAGVFEGIAVALERLLTAATRLMSGRRWSGRSATAAAATTTTMTTLPADSVRSEAPPDQRLGTTFPTPLPSSSSSSSTEQRPLMSLDTLNQLDKELFRLMSGLPLSNAAETQYANTAAAAFTAARSDDTLMHDRGFDRQPPPDTLPERPPWVSSELWESIFVTLNEWNVDES